MQAYHVSEILAESGLQNFSKISYISTCPNKIELNGWVQKILPVDDGSLGTKNLHYCPRFFTQRHVDVCLREELRNMCMRWRDGGRESERAVSCTKPQVC